MTKRSEPKPETPEADAAELAEAAVEAVTDKLAAVSVTPTGG
jgi:hypothetical protein